jgi:hypothetical protein
MRWTLVLLVVGCGSGPPTDQTHEPDAPGGGEIDGTYLDVRYGRCSGGVGGAIRCSGSPCDGLAETACGTAACVSAYTDDGAGALQFRECFPVDTRSTAPGSCASLTTPDACVTRPDCSPVYVGQVFGSFARCMVDPGG